MNWNTISVNSIEIWIWWTSCLLFSIWHWSEDSRTPRSYYFTNEFSKFPCATPKTLASYNYSQLSLNSIWLTQINAKATMIYQIMPKTENLTFTKPVKILRWPSLIWKFCTLLLRKTLLTFSFTLHHVKWGKVRNSLENKSPSFFILQTRICPTEIVICV